MHVSEKTAKTAQARHLQENLIERLEKGREWATPAVESALRRALAGVDSGIDAASPRLQASLRAIAEELAGGVETATPRLHERIARINPGGVSPAAVASRRKQPGKIWWAAAVLVAAAVGGLVTWRMVRPAGMSGEEPREERPARPGETDPLSPDTSVPPSRP